jgi:SAM-dependent methyltransferase
MIKECILCNSGKIKIGQKIKKTDLVDLYFKNFQFDISKEIEEDLLCYYNCSNCHTNFFDPKFAGSGFFYEQLQVHRKQYYSAQRKEFYFAKEHISNNDKVLEIGSGAGFFAKLIGVKKYVGLEFNDKAILDAKKEGIMLLKEDVTSFSKKHREEFDVVCSFHVLEHVQNPNSFITSSLNCLREGGKLIISVPCNNSLRTNNVNHVLNLPPHHLSRFFVKTLMKMQLIFNIRLDSYKLDSLGANLDKKNYVTDYLTTLLIALLYPSKKLLLEETTVLKLRRYIGFFNKKLRFYKLFKDSFVIEENMTFIFTKI